jgi:predicted nuclease of predicted toxin-antitoxin system
MQKPQGEGGATPVGWSAGRERRLLKMSWRLLTGPKTKAGERDLNRRTVGRSKFLVDESVGTGVAMVLGYQGYNVKCGPDVGLGGKDDQDVFAFAWRERRIILTHDKDFMDDRQFPFNRNPGVLVLPGEEGEFEPLFNAVRSMLNIFGTHGNIFPNAKIVDSDNVWYIKNYRKKDGYIERAKLRFLKNGRVYRWMISCSRFLSCGS